MNKMSLFLLNIAIFLFGSLLFLFSNPTFAQEAKFYHVNLSYDAGKIELKDIAVFPGEISQIPQEGEYRFELVSLTGTILYTDHFDIPLSIHGERIDPNTGEFVSRTITTDNTEIVLNIPYSPNGKTINIYGSSNSKVLEVPVIGFAQITPSPYLKSILTKLDSKVVLVIIFGGAIIAASIFVLFRGRFKKEEESIPNTP